MRPAGISTYFEAKALRVEWVNAINRSMASNRWDEAHEVSLIGALAFIGIALFLPEAVAGLWLGRQPYSVPNSGVLWFASSRIYAIVSIASRQAGGAMLWGDIPQIATLSGSAYSRYGSQASLRPRPRQSRPEKQRCRPQKIRLSARTLIKRFGRFPDGGITLIEVLLRDSAVE